MAAAESDVAAPPQVAAFRDALRSRGSTEGTNIQIEYRWTTGRADLIAKHSAELVSMPADVIVSQSAPALVALHKQTESIPIVFTFVSDPVGMGLVKSMGRPGGNITGFAAFEPSLGGKWLEVIKEIAPSATRAGVLFNPKTAPNAPSFLQAAQSAGLSLGVSVVPAHVSDDAEIDRVVAEFAQQPGGSLLVVPDPFTAARRDRIVAIAASHRLPLTAPFRSFAEKGALISYGISAPAQASQAATYVDRILRGEKPGELPVQAPTKFELVINNKTAKALGIAVPPSLLARADEVIE